MEMKEDKNSELMFAKPAYVVAGSAIILGGPFFYIGAPILGLVMLCFVAAYFYSVVVSE